MFKFSPKEKTSQLGKHGTRIDKPANNEDFAWWELAEPQPAYRVCVAEIVSTIDKDNIKVQLFDINNQAKGNQVTLDLRDWTRVWRGLPSTVEIPGNPDGKFGLIAISEKTLIDDFKWTKPDFQAFGKWPKGEDLIPLIQLVKELLKNFPKEKLHTLPHFDAVKETLGLA